MEGISEKIEGRKSDTDSFGGLRRRFHAGQVLFTEGQIFRIKTGEMGTLKITVKPAHVSSYGFMSPLEGGLFVWFSARFWGCFLSIF